MPSVFPRGRSVRLFARPFGLAGRPTVILLILAVCFFGTANSASVRGVVTDISGARVKGATVALLNNGQVTGSAVSGRRRQL